MNTTSRSIFHAFVPFVVILAHSNACAPISSPVPIPIVSDTDLIMVGQEAGASTNALYRFSADGTNGKIIEPGPVRFYAMSANRTRIVVDRGKPSMVQPTLYFVDPDGGNPASLVVAGELLQGQTPCLSISPTGKYVAFCTLQASELKALYVARTDGSPAKMVLPEGSNYFNFAWSPTEDKLAVSEQFTSLYVYDAAVEFLVEAMDPASVLSGYGRFAHWSPDGQRLAFNEITTSSTSALVTVDKQGQDRRELLVNMDRPMSSASWSPDGQYFAFSETIQYKDEFSDLWLVSADGTKSRSFLGTPIIFPLGWGPAGELVYYPLDEEIKSATLAGNDAVLSTPVTTLNEAIGPNGRLAYSADQSPLKTINVDGSNLITYSNVAKWVYSNDTWQLSDDGKVIVFAPNADANGYVPLYAAESDNAQTTVVLTATNQQIAIWLSPIVGSSGIRFQTENSSVGWILPTTSGLRAVYPQIPLINFDLPTNCYRSTYLMAFRSRSSMAIVIVRGASRMRDAHRVRERIGTQRDAHRARGCSPSRIAMTIGRDDFDAPAA